MPRIKLEVDKEMLKKAIETTESKKTFTSQSDMFEQAAGEYYELSGTATISPSVARSRAIEFGLEFKTPKGQRGNFSKVK